MQTVRYAIIGAKWGLNYFKNLSQIPNTEIVANCSLSDKNLPGKYFKSWEELIIWGEFDALIVAGPPKLNYQICLKALHNKKHVICEKPVAFNSCEVELSWKIAEENNLSFLVDYIHTFNPKFLSVINSSIYEEDNIFIHSEGTGFGPFREGNPPLWDWASHDVAMVLRYFGKEPKIVNSFCPGLMGSIYLEFSDTQRAFITYGNASVKSRKFIVSHLNHGKQEIFIDDKTYNSLKAMLMIFNNAIISGQRINNLNLAFGTTKILEKC